MSEYITISVIFHNQYGDHLPKQGWTKWGGAVYGIDKAQLDEWYCQACGEKQLRTLPSYMFPIDDFHRDYIRVCCSCKAQAVRMHVSMSWDLLHVIKLI